MSNALAKSGNAVAAMVDVMPMDALAANMVKSGFFKDARDVSHAIVKVQAGRELGLPPVASMTGIYIVEGKVTLAATTMAMLIQKSGKYRFHVLKHTDTACEIEFFCGPLSLGVSGFTIQDAARAGLAGRGPWKSYPRNMLYARAMSNGAKMYCPEVLGGPVYSTEEMIDAGKTIDGEAPAPRPVASKADPLAEFNNAVEGEVVDAPSFDVAEYRAGLDQLAQTHGWEPGEADALVSVALKSKGFARIEDTTPDWREKMENAFRDPAQIKKRNGKRVPA